MQNQSCMHLWGHSSVEKFRSCDAKAHGSSSLLQLTHCFQNMFFYQFVHSSESIFGRLGKLSQRSFFKCIHIFLKKLVIISEFFKDKLEVISFHKHVVFQLANLLFLFSFFLPSFFFSHLLSFPFLLFFSFLSYYHLFISSFFFFFLFFFFYFSL